MDSPRDHGGRTTDVPYLAREALLFLLLAPPLIAFLVADLPEHWSLDGAAGCIVATWLATVIIGVSLHAVVNRVARSIAGPPWRRHFGVVTAGTVTVIVVARLTFPLLAWIAPHVRGASWVNVGRALVVAVLYVVVGRILALMTERTRREAFRASEHERMALAARLSALQAQTNPHFLFNSLNAVASLIPVDPHQAEATVERLAGVLQYALASGDRGTVRLGDEIGAVRDYLAIESTRFGGRLTASIEVDPRAESVQVPPMMLQPLVENAILHGIASKAEGGTVWVHAAVDGAVVAVTVGDDGVGPGRSLRRGGTKTALRGLRERLDLLYGTRATFDVRERKGGGFECELRLPSLSEPARAA